MIGAGEGPALLLLHGIGGHCGQWAAQVAALGTRFGTLAWSARGYGQSIGPTVRTMGDFADDLLRLLDTLAVERIIAVGHSMGGRILLECAARAPDRIAGMVLSGAQSAFLAHMTSDEAAQYLARRRALFDDGAVSAERARALALGVMAQGAPPRAVDRLADDFTRLRRDGYLSAIRASIGWSREDILPDLDMPVMVIGGAQDTVCPPAECHRVAGRIGQGPALILDDVGHMAQIEAPERVTTILADFADRHGARASHLNTGEIP